MTYVTYRDAGHYRPFRIRYPKRLMAAMRALFPEVPKERHVELLIFIRLARLEDPYKRRYKNIIRMVLQNHRVNRRGV